ncbi:MAG: mitochondrial carrier domain-containing protein [Benjaminiella poitrasii]|nr:MAG: mitochondrial carrier domain-containing protein [Benjaminiella poitrasii]
MGKYNQQNKSLYQANLRQALVAGALAGTAAESVLFPLDTIKTRLQSRTGFAISGGFRSVYSGLFSAVVGSAPNAALFFVTYEAIKRLLGASTDGVSDSPYIFMTAATCGEISACTVRVPTEVIKQRMQIKQFDTTLGAVSSVLRTEGLLGFYRGFLPTVAREIPFTCIQFPFYEYLKRKYSTYKGDLVEPHEAALMGSIAGGFGAAITTPLDVCKTRIMLSSKSVESGIKPYIGIIETMKRIVQEEGSRKLFAGLGPRVLWISVGGGIFLGVYEKGLKTFTQLQLLEK